MGERRTKVVFVTQQLDPAHPNLAATVPQLEALAKRVDELVVLADTIVPDSLPPNARGRTFAAPTKVGRGFRFADALRHELRGTTEVVAHMCPVYAVLAAPLVRPARVPLVLWYTHWKDHWVLRLAERVSTRVASVDRRSFPFASRKLVPIGHGIDVARFPLRRESEPGPLRVLVVGRYSPAKGLETVLRAARLALDDGVDLRLELHGPTFTQLEREYRARLEPLVDELALRQHVTFGGAVPREELPPLLQSGDVLVNNARGGADRIVFEAAATGLSVLTSNRAHADLLDEDAFFDDERSLAQRLAAVAALSPTERMARGRELHQRVVQHHSVDSWSEGLLEVAR